MIYPNATFSAWWALDPVSTIKFKVQPLSAGCVMFSGNATVFASRAGIAATYP
jgi:hypothetical protein